MADTVFLHVGLPKTGTTYLQSVMWANRPRLLDQGVLVPGTSARQHMWASLVIREHPGLDNRQAAVRESWDSLLADVAAWPGTAVVSHEFFGGATAGQVARVAADLRRSNATEVHVVVTARALLSLVTGYWQEYVKHGFDLPLDEFPAETEAWDEWGWSTLDIESVLGRWGAAVRADHVHVLVLPGAGAPREALWEGFADLIGVTPTGFDTGGARENRSLGLVEAELLRRVSRELDGFGSALDRGVWIRGYLAHEQLVPRRGERFLPSPARIAELRRVAARQVKSIEAAGYDVRGELARLHVPDDLPPLRHPDDVTDGELLRAASETIASVLADTRRFRRENTALKKSLRVPVAAEAPPRAPLWVRGRRRVGRILRGSPGVRGGAAE